MGHVTEKAQNLAGAAKKPRKYTKYNGLTTKQMRKLKPQVAQLYGRGVSCHRIAVAYHEKLVPGKTFRSREDHIVACKRLLREWEREQDFRDMVFEEAVARLDVQNPLILEGIGKKAMKGRVDAAKLALAVTGRHNPVEQQQTSANVQIVFATNVPRPEVTGPPPIALSREVRAIARQAEAVRRTPDDED